MGNKAEALRILKTAYKTRPDADIAAHLGEVLWSLGQRDRAAVDLEGRPAAQQPRTRRCRKRSSACASSHERSRPVRPLAVRLCRGLGGRLRQPAPRRPAPADTANRSWSGRLALQVEDNPSQSFSAGFELKGSAAGRRTDPVHARSAAPWRVLAWAPGVGHAAQQRQDAQLRLGRGPGGACHRRRDSGGRAVRLAARHRHARCRLAGRPVPARHRGACGPGAWSPARRPTCGSCSSTRMKALYDVPAPAKLNLFLHVTGRRPDGYPPAAVGLHADRLVRHAAFRAAAGRRLSREDLGAAVAAGRSGAARGARLAGSRRARRRARTSRSTNRCRRRPAWAAAPPMRPPACWR